MPILYELATRIQILTAQAAGSLATGYIISALTSGHKQFSIPSYQPHHARSEFERQKKTLGPKSLVIEAPPKDCHVEKQLRAVSGRDPLKNRGRPHKSAAVLPT